MSVPPGEPRRLGPFVALLVAVVAIAAVSYLIPLVVTGNPQWFSAGPLATATSEAVVVPTSRPAPTSTRRPAAPTSTTAPRRTATQGREIPSSTEEALPTADDSNAPTPTAGAALPTNTPAAPADLTAAQDTLSRIQAATLPARDLYALHNRFGLAGAQLNGTPTPMPPHNYQVGDQESFWISGVIDHNYYTVTATLIDITDHGYWWIQNDYDVSQNDVKSLAQIFEDQLYPTDRENFGPEAPLAIENDSHITVLFAPIEGAGGYFSSSDSYPQSINPYSNQRKMIYIASDPSSDYSIGTLAHEFQHMIHFNRHLQQDIWINEGMSELAIKLNGLDVNDAISFVKNTDVQLNQWATTPDEARANYGAAFLFLTYFYEHYGGPKALDALMTAKGTNLDSIDNALQALGSQDKFADVFTNWALANWLDNDEIDDRYEYPDMRVAASPSQSFNKLPINYKGQVKEQGTDYLDIAPPSSSNLQVSFSGAAEVPLLNTTPKSGQEMWWSNRSDLSDTMLTHEFDLSGVQAATLKFALWYDLEDDFDYGYVNVSTDGGQTWKILKGQHSTDSNAVGNNLGWGYNGKSGGGNTAAWVDEEVDLSAYAGQKIQVRFEYITDDGYNAQGMAIDDISIPELNYSDDVESGDGGWVAQGFSRVSATIPQQYRVAVIKYPQGHAPTVEMLQLDAQNNGTLLINSNGEQLDRVVVMVAALAPYTIQRTNYTVQVQEVQ